MFSLHDFVIKVFTLLSRRLLRLPLSTYIFTICLLNWHLSASGVVSSFLVFTVPVNCLILLAVMLSPPLPAGHSGGSAGRGPRAPGRSRSREKLPAAPGAPRAGPPLW